MTVRRISNAVCIVAVCILSFALPSAQDKVKGKGVITGRSGDTFTLDPDEDTTMTLVVTADTKIYHSVGPGGRRKQVGPEVLIPGLKLQDWGTGEASRISVDQIYFDRDDLSLAKVIQAGLNPTAQQVATNVQGIEANRQGVAANQSAIAVSAQEIEANRQRVAANQQNIEEVSRSTTKRFSEPGQYSVKDQATVYFESGESAISDEQKQALAAIAKEALENGEKAYLIQVSAFADSSGSAASNEVLSKERAQAVVAYLLQDCGIPVEEGRSRNRRAEVKLLINKGIAGSGSK